MNKIRSNLRAKLSPSYSASFIQQPWSRRIKKQHFNCLAAETIIVKTGPKCAKDAMVLINDNILFEVHVLCIKMIINVLFQVALETKDHIL